MLNDLDIQNLSKNEAKKLATVFVELEKQQRLTQLAMLRLFKFLANKYSKKELLKDIDNRINEILTEK